MPEGRVTIVTGASQGIGRALASSFARQGDTVVLAARNRLRLEETAQIVQADGGQPLVVETDVTDPDSVAALVEKVTGELGRINVLINNSGVGGPSGRLWEIDPAEWRATFEVNVFGILEMSRAVLPVMVKQESGSVINIGSISGKRPLFGRSAYTTTKMALVGLTRTLALEAGPVGVRVNLISPGFVAGPRLDWVIQAQADARRVNPDEVRGEFEAQAALMRLTQASDVADVAVFLASDAARGITGADINVNSGAVMY